MRKETCAEMLQRIGTDGDLWAREFKRVNPYSSADADLLRAWFANAIEAGRAAGYQQARRELKPKKAL